MTNLKSRLEKLEHKSAPGVPTSFIRVIQDGDLTPEQEREIAQAEAEGKGVLLRVIV
jgi:predicted DNA binding protein